MIIKISLECDCGTTLNRNINTRIANSLSLTDNINDMNFGFNAKQTSPDETMITCKGCGSYFQLSI